MATLSVLVDTASAIRGELAALRSAGTLDEAGADLSTRFENAAALVDALRNGMEAATMSQKYTSLGLVELNRTLGEPLIIESEKLIQEARAIERGLTMEVDTAWQALHRPAANDAERAVFADRQSRLEKSDPIFREAWLMECARTGASEELLRAALVYPVPPLDFDGSSWRPLISARALEDLRIAFANRVSPQGPRAWRARLLDGLAQQLRFAVGNNQ